MSELFGKGTRVLVVGAFLALLVVAFPPWLGEVNSGLYDDHNAEMYNQKLSYDFLGFAFVTSPPPPRANQCEMAGTTCWTFLGWTWLAAELAALGLIVAAGWHFDRPRGKAGA